MDKILLWIGSGIAITVAVAWVLVQAHTHPEFVSHDELMNNLTEIKLDVRDLRAKQQHQLTAILEMLRGIHGDSSRNPNR